MVSSIADTILDVKGRQLRDQLEDACDESEPVVRRAWRSSQRLAADLDILVVRDPHEEPSAKEREQLEALRRLAAVLGAGLFVEAGEDVAEVAGRVARERGTTYILMGQPRRTRGIARLREPLATRLLRELPDVDVRILADRPLGWESDSRP